MFYTSRYCNRELDNNKYYTVGISLGKPKYALRYTEDEHLYLLAPDKAMWGKGHEMFDRMYNEKLDRLGANRVKSVLDVIKKRAKGKDVAFLCFEDVRNEGEFCHRVTLGEWVEKNIGYQMRELFDPSEPKNKGSAKNQKTGGDEDFEYKQMSFSFL